MVTLETVKFHTGYGETHQVGDVYELDDESALNVIAQGFAKHVEAAPPIPAKPSHPVTPITTDDLQ